MPILHVRNCSGSPSTVDKKTCVRVGLGIGSGNSLTVGETCARALVRRSIKIIIIIIITLDCEITTTSKCCGRCARVCGGRRSGESWNEFWSGTVHHFIFFQTVYLFGRGRAGEFKHRQRNRIVDIRFESSSLI